MPAMRTRSDAPRAVLHGLRIRIAQRRTSPDRAGRRSVERIGPSLARDRGSPGRAGLSHARLQPTPQGHAVPASRSAGCQARTDHETPVASARWPRLERWGDFPGFTDGGWFGGRGRLCPETKTNGRSGRNRPDDADPRHAGAADFATIRRGNLGHAFSRFLRLGAVVVRRGKNYPFVSDRCTWSRSA